MLSPRNGREAVSVWGLTPEKSLTVITITPFNFFTFEAEELHNTTEMYYELSKGEKKIARACIDKALEAEFYEGLERFEAILQDWRKGKFASNKEAYHQLYKAVDRKDNAISKRYDKLGGSRWLITVAAVLHDGYISENDIKDFSDQTKALINGLIKNWKNE
ncbi:MAG TPA: hypothetical protein VF141_02730 [Chryseolinea sp.]